MHTSSEVNFTPTYHRDEALHHADEAEQAMQHLQESVLPPGRAKGLHQAIGVHLKLADIHARLALVAAGQSSELQAFPDAPYRLNGTRA